MKKIALIFSFIFCLVLLASCEFSQGGMGNNPGGFNPGENNNNNSNVDDPSGESSSVDIPTEPTEEVETSYTITCESGTQGIYSESNGVLTFGAITEKSVYSITGSLSGSIVINTGDDYKFELVLNGVTIDSTSVCPIAILSGDSVTLTAKKDTENTIYDRRSAVADDSEDYGSAIYSKVDLTIGGQGKLTVTSTNNNGIHSKDDLEVKNCTLNVSSVDNCLKGNDSVTISDSKGNCNITLISRQGDGIKTSNSDISSKGNQRGTVSITGGTINIYAACDGIDASYNVEISDSAVLNIFTDKYSNYSEEITAMSDGVIYIKATNKTYNYSIKYYNSDTDYKWVNLTYYTTQSSSQGGRPGGWGGNSTTYYYYKGSAPSNYSKMDIYCYTTSQTQGQSDTYYSKKTSLTTNSNYDTIAVTISSSSMSTSWTNYTTQSSQGGWGGPGGMQDGNTDKGDHSTKGLKAANEINISGGTINIKAYDDAIHANNDSTLENGATPTGNVNISGGKLTLYSNDDGVHADGIVTISGGEVTVTNSYEGVEGNQIIINGGKTAVTSKDDGFNSTATSGAGITFNSGYTYVYAGGDGIDANSKTSYKGIIFNGGTVVVVSTTSMNSCIDTEQGYTYTGGTVMAMCPSNGMWSESIKCSNYNSIGKNTNISGLTTNSYVVATVNGNVTLALKMPCSLTAVVIYLGSSSVSLTSTTSFDKTLDSNGVYVG